MGAMKLTSGTIIAGGNGNGFGLNQLSAPSSIYPFKINDNTIFISEAGQ